MEDHPLTPHAARNRTAWDRTSDAYQARHGEQLRGQGGLTWGVWQRPEQELRILGDVTGRDVLELGCGAAQWSIALARLGARVTGLDLSEAQLAHARALVAEAGVDVTLVCASAEATPLPDASFDVVFCDWGAMTFGDPHLTVPEAARLLRPAGLLAFNTSTPIVECVWPQDAEHPSRELVVDYWDLDAITDPEGMTNFQMPYGEWIGLFRSSGFIIESLIELRAPAEAHSSYRDENDHAWARRWPMENIWRVRREA